MRTLHATHDGRAGGLLSPRYRSAHVPPAAPARAAHGRAHHVGLRGDVDACRRGRRGEPRPGLPRHRRPAGAEGRRDRGDPGRARQPVPSAARAAAAARGDRRPPAALLRPRRRPRHRGRRRHGCVRDHPVDPAGPRRRGRRGDRLRAVVRHLRGRHLAGPRSPRGRADVGPGPAARPGRAAGGRHAADAADPAELAAQPDGHRLHAATSWPRWRASPSTTTCWSCPTRPTSTCGSTATRTCRSRRCRACGSARSPSGSGGKSFSFTGWKIGWATGPADLIGAVRVVRQHLSYVSGGPFQYAIAHGLGLPDEYFAGFRATWPASATCSATDSRPSGCG